MRIKLITLALLVTAAGIISELDGLIFVLAAVAALAVTGTGMVIFALNRDRRATCRPHEKAAGDPLADMLTDPVVPVDHTVDGTTDKGYEATR
jgi:hypothetical protein